MFWVNSNSVFIRSVHINTVPRVYTHMYICLYSRATIPKYVGEPVCDFFFYFYFAALSKIARLVLLVYLVCVCVVSAGPHICMGLPCNK